MNIYLWRHNKTYHSHSMIDEPLLEQRVLFGCIGHRCCA